MGTKLTSIFVDTTHGFSLLYLIRLC